MTNKERTKGISAGQDAEFTLNDFTKIKIKKHEVYSVFVSDKKIGIEGSDNQIIELPIKYKSKLFQVFAIDINEYFLPNKKEKAA